MTIKQFIIDNYTRQNISHYKTSDVHGRYVKYTQSDITKHAFSREMSKIGFKTKRRRFGDEVQRVYFFDEYKKPCHHCNGTGYTDNY